MKRLIKGIIYDTDKATVVAQKTTERLFGGFDSYPSDTTTYVMKASGGSFFIHSRVTYHVKPIFKKVHDEVQEYLYPVSVEEAIRTLQDYGEHKLAEQLMEKNGVPA